MNTPSPNRSTLDRASNARPSPTLAGLLGAALALLVLLPALASAQDDPAPTTEASDAPTTPTDPCVVPGKNTQCNEFGSIQMDSQAEIRGEPVVLSVSFTLNTLYKDRNARSFMVSVRNTTQDGSSPIVLGLVSFKTAFGDVLTTRVEQGRPSEMNLWVDILDAPLLIPVELTVQVGSTERGAFRIEVLVMPFDRGYSTISDASGHPASLFAFANLGVNKETPGLAAAGQGGSIMQGHKLPGFEAAIAVSVAGLVALILYGRRFR